MEAGQELDALIAEKVMGFKRWEGVPNAFHAKVVLPYQTAEPCEPPHYSTDIASSWQVAEKVWEALRITKYEQWALFDLQIDANGMYWATFIIKSSSAPDHKVEVFENSAPLAICGAALKALEVKDAIQEYSQD